MNINTTERVSLATPRLGSPVTMDSSELTRPPAIQTNGIARQFGVRCLCMNTWDKRKLGLSPPQPPQATFRRMLIYKPNFAYNLFRDKRRQDAPVIAFNDPVFCPCSLHDLR